MMIRASASTLAAVLALIPCVWPAQPPEIDHKPTG
jgi:hypothetical protein